MKLMVKLDIESGCMIMRHIEEGISVPTLKEDYMKLLIGANVFFFCYYWQIDLLIFNTFYHSAVSVLTH